MNTDAFEFYGYHGIVYRPLPGSPAVTVQYRISVQDRNTEEILDPACLNSPSCL